MGDYRRLTVWRAAHAVTKTIYRVTGSFPAAERWRLTDQLCRAAVSVPANIAEGAGRNTEGDFARFLAIALGSANEVEYHLLLAKDLGYLSTTDAAPLEQQVGDIKRMLAGLIARIRANSRRPPVAPKLRSRTLRADS